MTVVNKRIFMIIGKILWGKRDGHMRSCGKELDVKLKDFSLKDN